MVLDVLREIFTPVETLFQFCMGDITTYDNRTVERKAGSYRIFIQLGEDFVHRTVEVDLHRIAFACLTEFFGNQFAWIRIQLLNPDTVLVDLTFDVTVCRARYPQTYRT